MADVKKNFFYSCILTSANYIFPIITYPYVSRVLGVTNIGICNFIDSIINYYMMFSMMGIVAVGIREIAANTSNRQKLSKSFSNLLILNSISTGIVLLLLIISIYSIPKLYEHRELMFIGFFKVIFNYLQIEWFYKGIENFKYITKYGLLTKIIYVVGIFIFIKEQTDYNIYYLLSMLMIAASAVINLWHTKAFVDIKISNLSLKPYIRPFLILGTYILLTSMYTTFNVAYLGFVCGETEVGYYTTATKLHSIFLSLFTAFTGVMLPRMSSLVSKGQIESFKELLSKSLHTLFIFAIPVIIFTTVYASQIIEIIAGPGYEFATIPMRMVMPLILIIGYEQIIVLQVVMPLKKDKDIFINSIIGAIWGLLLNILIVSQLKSIGSAIVWITSELIILTLSQLRLKKYVNMKVPTKELIHHTLWAIPCILTSIIISKLSNNTFYIITVGFIFISIYYYVIYIKIFKDEFVIRTIKQLTKIFSKRA